MKSDDNKFMHEAYQLAKKSYNEGGLPIGAVLVREGVIIGRGHNKRIQCGDPIAHGEMDCIRNAGRQKTYVDTVLYTTLSPCMMCSGTIIQFKIPKVVIGENFNFGGNEEFLMSNLVDIVILNDERCTYLMKKYINKFKDEWHEDICEDN